MIKGKRALTLIISIMIGILIFFLIACPFVNDISAKKVTEDICSIPLPESTRRLEEVSRAGKLVGSGNGMQYFGAILVESDLTLEELEAYYSKYRHNEWSYLVARQDTQEIQVVEHVALSFLSDISDKHCYIIYSWGNGIEPFSGFDLRGN